MNLPPSPSRRRDFLVHAMIALIGVVGTIAAALISVRCTPANQSEDHQSVAEPMRRVLLNFEGSLLREDLRVVGPRRYERTFNSGEIEIPLSADRSEFYVYEAKKLIGTIIVPSCLEDDLIVIEVKIKSEHWQPNLQDVANALDEDR